jgi:hypothetical protein
LPADGDASVAICDSLNEAMECAKNVTAHHLELCCEIYDHEGKSGEPLETIYNPFVEGRYRGRPYARRVTAWGGGIFLCGVVLIAVDVSRDLAWIWGHVLGLKMVVVGTGLLVRGLSRWYEHRKSQSPTVPFVTAP